MRGPGKKPATLATFKTFPCLRFAMSGTNARHRSISAITLVWTRACCLFASLSTKFASYPNPALFTSVSTTKFAPRTLETSFSTASGFEKSAMSTHVFTPYFFWSEFASASSSVLFLPTRAIVSCSFCLARFSQSSLPIPHVDPVTRAQDPGCIFFNRAMSAILSHISILYFIYR